MQKLSWLENLRKCDPLPAPRPDVGGSDPFLRATIFDHPASAGEVGGVDEFGKSLDTAPDSIGDMIRRDAMLKGVADASWNAPLNGVCDAPWYEPVDKALSPERSKERFEKVRESLKKVFKSSPEYDEALALCRKVLDEERAAVLLGRELPRADGTLLSKSAVSSEMLSTLSAFKKYCTREEIELLGKAVKSLDLPAFFEVSRGVLARQAA